MNKTILICILVFSYSFCFAQQKPFGVYVSDIKEYYYNNWLIKEGDSINFKNNTKAEIITLKKYKDRNTYHVYAICKSANGKTMYDVDQAIFDKEIIAPENTHIKVVSDSRNYAYPASNGITYFVDDKIRLGRGSAADGTYKYLVNIKKSATDTLKVNAERRLYDHNVRLKSIYREMVNGTEKVYFIVGGFTTNFNLSIEDAIASCEIADCHKMNEQTTVQGFSAADELLKFKKLMDDGVITKEEFEAKKKKLLE